MCAFRLLGGRDYWDAENIALLLAKIVYEPVLPPSRRGLDLGAEFDDWFLRSCARNPTERWESVGRQIEELARALECPVHSLTVLEPSSHNPIARIDDRTISRVDERNRGVDSLDATATSADVVRSSRIGVIRLALAAASVLAVSTVLYSRIFSSREHEAFHAPTQSLKTPVSPAEIPTRDAPKPASAELPESSDRAVTASSLPIDTKLPLLPRPVVSSVRRRPVLPSLQREATPSPSTAPAVPSSAPLSPSSPRDPLADPD